MIVSQNHYLNQILDVHPLSKAFVEQPQHVFADCSESTLVYDNDMVNLETIDLGGLVIMITTL